MREWAGRWDDEHDVVVVGAGAIGLTAALAACSAGARVIVVEKSGFIGGTAAVSGGMLWAPMNHHMGVLGVTDSKADALAYLRAVTAGRTPESTLDVLIERGPEMLQFLESRGLTMAAMPNFPDYHPEWVGAHQGGRSLEPERYDSSALGSLAASLRPDSRLPFTMREYE